MINEKYTITNELTPAHIEQLHNLYKQMWWSKDRTREDLQTLIETCMVFAVVDSKSNQLVGFARVLTDKIRYAYIYDVMTEEPLRGKGIGKMIMRAILAHPQLSRVKYLELTCAQEMVDYYKILGFKDTFENVIPMRHTKMPTAYKQ